MKMVKSLLLDTAVGLVASANHIDKSVIGKISSLGTSKAPATMAHQASG